MEIPPSFIKGFGTAIALIMPIGIQNAFVLRQGIRRQYVFLSAFICVCIDAALITAGVMGMGKLMTSNPLLMGVAQWGGAAFLFYFGARCFRRVFQDSSMTINTEDQTVETFQRFLINVFALSLLNPHTFLDTIVLIGSIGGQYTDFQRTLFVSGTVTASAVWFFGLAYGAALLRPLFQKPIAWKILDTLVGCLVWWIAYSLIFGDMMSAQAL